MSTNNGPICESDARGADFGTGIGKVNLGNLGVGKNLEVGAGQWKVGVGAVGSRVSRRLILLGWYVLHHRVKQMHLILWAPGGLPKYQCQLYETLMEFPCNELLFSGISNDCEMVGIHVF